MPRSFTAVRLPDTICERIRWMQGGIRDARWVPPEQLHLTVHFLGDVEGATARAAEEALHRMDGAAFELTLRGVGVFPPRGDPRVLWIGVARDEPLQQLYVRGWRQLSALGIEAERRNYAPHVTIARLRGRAKDRTPAWLTQHALLEFSPFRVETLGLYSSVLSPSGAKYRLEAEVPLSK